ncbi:MAG: hypothetical protein V3U32_03375, partial [Anaerolineales bacterium]
MIIILAPAITARAGQSFKMPRSLKIRRSRRSARREGSGQLIAALALILALVAGLGLLGASAYLAIVNGLPDVVQVEAQFGMRGAE